MMSLIVLAVCSLPPLAIAAMALSSLRAGRLALMLPVAVTAAVLLVPLLMLSPSGAPEVAGLRFRPVDGEQSVQTYARRFPAPMPLTAAQ